MAITGHCLCTKSKVIVDADEPALVAQDHCDDCQRESGSAFSWVAVFPKDKVKFEGPVKTYSGSKGSSGQAVCVMH